MIPYGRQDITQADIDAVVSVLNSDFITQGPAVPKFEAEVAKHCSVEFAIASNSATSALHIACLALGLEAGDWLWTTPNTFVASANCGLYCGAQIDFVDIDPHTYNMSIEALAQKLVIAKKRGTLPKIVVPVHLCGQSCDMATIHALGKEYGFRIIEDASHAIGGKYKGEPIGNCRFSDITVFSFHPVKIITSGEGGMSVTNSGNLADKMFRLRAHGISSNSVDMHARPADEIWNYQQLDLGYNYRMTDIQAVLGCSQMERLHEYIEKRHTVARRYSESLGDLPIQLPFQHADSYSSYHLYPIRVRATECGKTQRYIYDALRAAGIGVNLHYIPVYRQPFYEAMGFKAGYCPESERHHKETLSIPMYPTLTIAQQDKVIAAIRHVIPA